MSHPLYNPFASGKQSSSQEQYGLSGRPTARDPGPGSRFSPPGASSVTTNTFGGAVLPQLALPASIEIEQSEAKLQSNVELNIQAREEIKLQPVGQAAHFTRTQREEIPSTSRGLTSHLTPSASQGHGHSNVESGSSSLDCLPIYKKTPKDDSSTSIPDSRDCDTRVTSQLVSPESIFSEDTRQLADKIMKDFGLENDDLNALLSYPDDETTVENLPFILYQIRTQKAKRAAAAVKSVPLSELQPTTSTSGIERMSKSGMVGMHQDDIPSTVLQQNKVIEYGNTGKYSAGAEDEIGKTVYKSGENKMLMDPFSCSSHSRELQRGSTTGSKSSSLDSTCDQTSSVTIFRSVSSSSAAPPSIDPAKQLQTQPDQTLQPICIPFSQPKQNIDTRFSEFEVSKSLPSKEPLHDSTSNTQPSSTLVHDVNSSHVLMSSTDDSCNHGHSKTQGQESVVGEQMKKQQQVQQVQQQQTQPHQVHLPPVLQMWHTFYPAAKSVCPVPPPYLNSTVTDATHPHLHSVVSPSDLHQSISLSSQPIQSPADITNTPCYKQQSPANKASSKGLPSLAMMHDYAAVTPRVFSHTCSLCKKECAQMKVSGRTHPIFCLFGKLVVVCFTVLLYCLFLIDAYQFSLALTDLYFL